MTPQLSRVRWERLPNEALVLLWSICMAAAISESVAQWPLMVAALGL